MEKLFITSLDGERTFTYTKGVELVTTSKQTMSQTQYIKLIENKIKRLNTRIDLKIINGQSYSQESQEHKALLRKITSKKQSAGLFGKLFAGAF